MDWIMLRKKAVPLIQKYWYAAVILLLGIFLMLIPSEDKTDSEAVSQTLTETESSENLERSLSRILSKMEGAGEVEVLLTLSQGESSVFQMDESSSGGTDIRREAVVISGSDRAETGLLRQVNPPVYKGAVVLCQGADSAAVRLAVIQAVANATGLSTDKISVLKMK